MMLLAGVRQKYIKVANLPSYQIEASGGEGASHILKLLKEF